MSAAVELAAGDQKSTLDVVLATWRRLLQRSSVLADDDFFDLGGDSLLAIQLFVELDRLTGCRLPITAIYDANTAAKLAALLDQTTDRPAFSPLVLMSEPLEGEATQAPIFVIHGVGGNVMELAQLGKSIDPARRVFAIQARGLDGVEPAIESVDGMAEYYLEAVRREQPQGPYLLLGYSFGGIVALEMARRIEAAGQSVAFLGFIDTYPHPNDWPLISWLDVRWRRAAHRARIQLQTQTSDLARWAAGRDPQQRQRGATAIARPFIFDEDWPESVRRVYDTTLRALSRYRLSAYKGSVVFFRAASRSFYLPNSPRRMWGNLLGKLEIVTVPGDHVDMVGPNAATLGAEIAARICRAAASAPGRVDR